jgi:large subunit ribosomal protein L24
MKILKGDKVRVISGANRGKEGTVLKTFPKDDTLIVEGVNTIKKHTKPSQANPDGGILEFEAPIHASNVMYLDGKETTRIGFKEITDTVKKEKVTRKVRFAKKSGEVLD